MRQKLDLCGEYIANNPYAEKRPSKHILMEYAFRIYKKARISISRYYPLAPWQIHTWTEKGDLFFNKESNAAKHCLLGETNPFFEISYLSIMELVPKEAMIEVRRGINRFKAKHAQKGGSFAYDHSIDWFEAFNDGTAHITLDSFAIHEGSKLFPYVAQMAITAINLSSSFLCLNIKIILNKQLVKRISDYSVSNVPAQFHYCGFEQKRWYEFRHLGQGYSSGNNHKFKIIDHVLTDIVWKTSRLLYRYIPSLCFISSKNLPPHICSFKTNIDGNRNKSFWQSLDIESRLCDFTPDLTAGIIFCRNGCPFFIYTEPEKSYDTISRNRIMAYDISDCFCDDMICSKVISTIRNVLSKYSKRIALKNTKLKRWLKLKVQLDTETFFFVRFLREINSTNFESDASEYMFINLRDTEALSLQISHGLKSSVDKAKQLYADIVELFQNHIDYKSNQHNFKMQKLDVRTAVISLLIAIIALFVSLFTSDTFTNNIITLIQYVYNLFS